MDNVKFVRDDVLFSLCGLNCSLCPMFVRGDCTGCRAGSWCAASCRIAPCSVRHGGIDYCFECPEYPCAKYDGIDKRDSLMSHRNQLVDMEKAKRIGIEAYRDEQRAKAALLHQLLDEFDDGYHDVFFCLAANMLSLEDLTIAVEKASAQAKGTQTAQAAEAMRAAETAESALKAETASAQAAQTAETTRAQSAQKAQTAERILRETAAKKDVPLELRTWNGPW